MMIALETKRLVVRNFEGSDCEALHEMIVQYESSGMAAYDQQWPTSLDEIQGITEGFAGGDQFLAVCLQETGRFIGFVALNPGKGEAGGEYNIGYVFHSDYHGHGYAAEACTGVLDRAFGQLQASRVITATAVANHSSCRLLERLGFQRIGEKTGSFRKAADGTPIVFPAYESALSKEEWEKIARESF